MNFINWYPYLITCERVCVYIQIYINPYHDFLSSVSKICSKKLHSLDELALIFSAVRSQIFHLGYWNLLWVYKRNSGSFSVLVIEKCILKQMPLAVWQHLHSNLWIINIRMYKLWATVNIFIVSFLHLLQGSDYENGSVKVGDHYLLSFLII